MTLVNGIEADAVSVHDRGLSYGDGLFETFAVAEGRPIAWEPHISRLQNGCQRLRIPCPAEALLRAEATRVCAGLTLGVLKIIVTRGANGRGYRIPEVVNPSRILTIYPWPAFPRSRAREGVRVTVCQTRLAANPGLAGIKHLNRLEQVLARSEWDGPHYAEGLMLDTAGRVVEGTMSNLFLVIDGQLVTPDLADAGVAGIMRGLVLAEAAALDIGATVAPVGLDDLRRAEELFLCNSLFGVWPIKGLDGQAYRVGPLALRLRHRLLAKGYIAAQA